MLIGVGWLSVRTSRWGVSKFFRLLVAVKFSSVGVRAALVAVNNISRGVGLGLGLLSQIGYFGLNPTASRASISLLVNIFLVLLNSFVNEFPQLF